MHVPVRARRGGVTETGYVGSGYLEPYLTNTGLKRSPARTAADPGRDDGVPDDVLLQAYVPILPKHIWTKYTQDQIGNDTADGLLRQRARRRRRRGDRSVRRRGMGARASSSASPATRTTGGRRGVPDEIIFQQFADRDTMVQALKAGEIDYVRGTRADQFDALDATRTSRRSEGFSNGYTYLSFNTRGNTDGYHGSTSALADQKFRDALGYAIDRQELVDKVLKGHGVRGHDARAAVSRQVARRARPIRGRSTSPRRTGASTPRATPGTPTATGWTRRARRSSFV